MARSLLPANTLPDPTRIQAKDVLLQELSQRALLHIGTMDLILYRVAVQQDVVTVAWSTFMQSMNDEMQIIYAGIMDGSITREDQIVFGTPRPSNPADSLIPLVDLSA